MCITVEIVGRRHYFRGNTYPVKNELRSAGAHWDADQKAWWIGKRDVAEQLRAKLCGSSASGGEAPKSDRPASHPATEALKDSDTVRGRARYKGKEYLLVWDGQTKRGYAAKLAFTDGSKVFWADGNEIQVTKTYETREYRGREQPMTFGKLRRLREEFAAEKKQERELAKTDGVVGERGEYQAQFEATRSDRKPTEALGAVVWLRHGQQRIAVVLVGYEPATYVRSDDAEDMGHYGVRSGYYGYAHYRAATTEEYADLQAKSFRVDGVCVGGVEPDDIADRKAALKAAGEQEAARQALVAWIAEQVRERGVIAADGSIAVPAGSWTMHLAERNEYLHASTDAVYVSRHIYDYGTSVARLAIDAADVAFVGEILVSLSSCTAHADCRASYELARACTGDVS